MKVLRAWVSWLDIVILSWSRINFPQIGHEPPYKVLPYDWTFQPITGNVQSMTHSLHQLFLPMWPIHLNFFAPTIFLHTTRAKHKLILANFSDLRREERRRDLTCNQMQSAQPDANYLLVINPGIIETTSSQTRPLENFPPISPNLGIFIRV